MPNNNLDKAIKRIKEYSESTQAKQSLKNCQQYLSETTKRIYEEQQPSADDMRHKFTV